MNATMSANDINRRTEEISATVKSGWGMLFLVVGLFLTPVALIVLAAKEVFPLPIAILIPLILGSFVTAIIFSAGFFTLQPNEARVLILFGRYVGSLRESGFHWTNPFYSKRRISLRTHNFNGDKLKVNDKRGNPIEIAAVVVWHVENIAQAMFDVEDYLDYVEV